MKKKGLTIFLNCQTAKFSPIAAKYFTDSFNLFCPPNTLCLHKTAIKIDFRKWSLNCWKWLKVLFKRVGQLDHGKISIKEILLIKHELKSVEVIRIKSCNRSFPK